MDIGSLTGQIAIEDQLSSGMSLAIRRVQQFASEFKGLAGVMVTGGAAIVGSITAISGSIIALGNRGSDVNDVATSFKNFSGSVLTAEESLRQMRDGTLGTVTDFDLMKNASKLLAADVRLTSDQFGTLTKAAFVLQNEGLGSTKDMLELVSQAMLTGRTRTLEMKIGKIDLKKAEEDYARSMNKTRDQLSELGKTEARRIALLEALNKKVQGAGKLQRDFGETMEFVVTSVKNWGDQLASQVAKSPNVINAVQAIGDALSASFGGTAQSALQMIVGWINRFADLVALYAPIIIRWVSDIAGKVRSFIDRVIAYWDTVPDWFKNIAKEAVVTAGVLYIAKESIQALSETTNDAVTVGASFATMISGTRDTFLSLIELQTAYASKTWAAARAIKALALQVQFFGVQQSLALAGMYLWNTGLGTLVTSLSGVGAAIGVFLLTPLGLVTVAIPALILAIRYLTGSWEFLLTPMRTAWDVLKDVWTITVDLASSLTEMLRPAIDLVAAGFRILADTIGGYFSAQIKKAKEDLFFLYGFLLRMPQFQNLRADVKTIGGAADLSRTGSLAPGQPTGFGGLGGVTPPSAEAGLAITDEMIKSMQKAKEDERNLFKSDFTSRVESLAKSWQTATTSTKVFEAAFKSLTAAQRDNHEIQKLVAPEINKMLAAQQKVTPEMLKLRDAELATRLERIESQKTWLEGNNLTQGQIDRMQQLGMSMEDIAGQYGVAGDSLSAYISKLKEQEQRQLALASFEGELLAQQERDRKRKEQIASASNEAIAQSERELNDFMRQQSMTTTEYQIDQIEREAAASIATFSASGASADAIKQYTDFVMKLSGRRVNALMRDEESLKTHSRETLQEQANKAKATYLEMANHPEKYHKDTVKHFKKIADEAQHAADGTKSAWQQAYEGMSDVADILDAIPGKFTEIGAMAARAGLAIMDNLAKGDWIGALIAGATAAISILGKLFGIGPTDYEKRVREAAARMKELREEAVKAAGSFERLALNARMVSIHIQGAFDSGDPEFVSQILDEIADKTQKLTAAMEEYGFTWEDLGAEFRGAQLADQFDVLFEKTQLLKGAGIDYTTILERQAEDYSELLQAALRTGTEIPIGMQPVLEDLLEMGKLVDENGVAFENLEDVSWAKTMTQGFEDVTTAIYELRDALVNGVGGALDDIGNRTVRPTIAPIWEGPGDMRPEVVEPSYYASGGTVVPFRSRGSDTVPAMLTPGERVIPRGAEGSKVIIELNGRWLAEAVVPEIPGAVKRLGVR